MGMGVELELALLAAALERLDRLPSRAVMTVNTGPEALVTPGACELLGGADASRVVVELTEHAAVEDYPPLADALEAAAQPRVSGWRSTTPARASRA